MDAGSFGSVRNEDRIGSAGNMEQDQFLQEIKDLFIFSPFLLRLEQFPHFGRWSFHSHFEEAMLHSCGMESTGASWQMKGGLFRGKPHVILDSVVL